MDFSIYKKRRQELLNGIKKTYPGKKGFVIIFASFEHERYKFRQNSSFYYLTGIEEPAVTLILDLDCSTTLYIPHYGESRSKWLQSVIYGATKETLTSLGIDNTQFLGNPCKGYTVAPACTSTEYEQLIKFLEEALAQQLTIFALYPPYSYTEQTMMINQLSYLIPDLKNHITDISPLVARMRRTKTQAEVEAIFKAVDCTMAAQEAAAHLIEPGKYEYNIQAGVEFMFTESGGSPAFPSIVASGINGTVLHYAANKAVLKKSDLVIVDIGAELDYYCADLTRTYPASGRFTKRQLELYNLVLETQDYIATIVQPGYWLFNKQQPEKSLHHLAYEFLQEHAYAQYFTHNIGHFLGLDVHDVGDYTQPLQEGDVITIEPGIYIPNEKLGIRIEDNYWIVKEGVVCLSQELTKNPHEIEELMAGEFDDGEEE
jgi:Xaa-Pro aminopeptidase